MIVILIIRPNDPQTRLSQAVNLRDDRSRGHRVVDTSKRDADGHQQAKRVNDDISFSTGDFLASVVSAAFARLCAGDRFRVDATGTGELLSVGRIGLPNQLSNVSIQSVQSAVVSPSFEVVVDCALGQQIMRKHVPLTAAAGLVLNRVIHFAKINFSRLTEVTRWSQSVQLWADQLPLFVGNIRLVCSSFGIHRGPLRCGKNHIVRVLRRFRHRASRIVSESAVLRSRLTSHQRSYQAFPTSGSLTGPKTDLVTDGISRFSRLECPRMHRFTDSAVSEPISPSSDRHDVVTFIAPPARAEAVG